MCSPRGRSIAAKPVIIRSFTKRRYNRSSRSPSAEAPNHSVAHLPGTLLLSLVALSVLDTDGLPDLRRFLAFLMNAHGFGQEASIGADLLGRRDFGGALAGVSAQAAAGAGEALPQPPPVGVGLWEPPFAVALLRTTGLGAGAGWDAEACNQRRLHETGLRHSHLTGDRGAGPGQTLPPASKRLVAQPFR